MTRRIAGQSAQELSNEGTTRTAAHVFRRDARLRFGHCGAMRATKQQQSNATSDELSRIPHGGKANRLRSEVVKRW
jgi:hypothetical protein